MAEARIPICVERDGLFMRATPGVLRKLTEAAQFSNQVASLLWVTPDEYNALFSGRASLTTKGVDFKSVQISLELPELRRVLS